MSENLYSEAFYRAAALALSGRHADGSLPVEDFNIELEDQNGQKVNLGSETDQKYNILEFLLFSSHVCLRNNQPVLIKF